MSLASLPSTLRMSTFSIARRTFSTTSAKRASILFALNALSNSRETQHFNKLSGLPRIEHSPPLKLIKTSEVDPLLLPSPLSRATQPPVRVVAGARSAARAWDNKALKVGRAILADQARHAKQLQRALERAKRREARQGAVLQTEEQAFHEANKLRDEKLASLRLMIFGTATAVATWHFWPQQSPFAADSGEMGRRIAERARRLMPLPTAVSADPTVTAPITTISTVQSAQARTVEPARAMLPSHSLMPMQAPQPTSSWWRSLFWKQQ
ncbi:hypothetical protein LTR36_010861 [Oleoguttula mirabilis]|uniref:Uncharacterized protein n=1 Tax=Oleoguttula mirabilis TaxID=1507867 RepID=A0AAV9J3M0_9PEZI|nr:hypothetical protein LTR36_010861 [Oleoguttula mirabilis]